MTQRKPSDLSFDSWIDLQIREAQARGLFDDLSGSGKPQSSLRDAEDPLWWAKQFLRREQVSYLPPAVEVRVRAQKLREVLAALPSERAVREAAEALNADIRRVNRMATDGPPTRQAPLDVAALVAAWQAARADRERAPSPSESAADPAQTPMQTLPAGDAGAGGETAALAKRRALLSRRPSGRGAG
jgi:hypothetical protein